MKQTIAIPLADLRQFKKNSSFIKQNGIIPILDYIKFDNGQITKTNQNEYIIFKSNFTGSFLVEERVLFNFIEYASGNELLFSFNGKKITLSDGNTEVTSQSEDLGLFPIPEICTQDKIELPNEVLLAISTAAQYTQEYEFDPKRPYVFVGAKAVAASDGLIGFYKKFDIDLPEMVLSEKTATKIGSLSSVMFCQNERYLFFETPNSTYGFIKPEPKFFNLGNYFNYPKEVSFIVNKRDFIAFNDTCIAVSPSKAKYPTFKIEGNMLHLSMVDHDYNINVKRLLSVSGEMKGEFPYIAVLMSKLLKSAPDEDLIFYQGNKKFYIIGDSGFTSLVMELVLKTP